MIWNGTRPNELNESGSTIGMSLLVRIVGIAMFVPALQERKRPPDAAQPGPIRALNVVGSSVSLARSSSQSTTCASSTSISMRSMSCRLLV